MRKLAERLQTIFEEAYESNQPYATREENVDAIFAYLDDAKNIDTLLRSLDEIKTEYKIGMDEEIDEIYQELQELRKEWEIESNNTVLCLETQIDLLADCKKSLNEIKNASISEVLDYFCQRIMDQLIFVQEYLVTREQEHDIDIEALTDKIWNTICESEDGDVDYVLKQYADTRHFTESLEESIRKVLHERQEEQEREITEQMPMG